MLAKGELIDQLPAHGTIHKYADRDEWLAARKAKCHGGAGRIGGSTASGIFGVGHETMYGLWAYHTGLDVPPSFDSGVMRRGRRLEVPILEELADVTGWTVEHWPQMWTIQDPDPALRLASTPDGLAKFAPPKSKQWAHLSEFFPDGELLTIQVKSANEWAKKTWPRNEGGGLAVPMNYEVQTQVELRCTGLRYGALVVLFGMDMDNLEIIPFERHDAFQDSLAAQLLRFWEYVDNGECPEIDGEQSTARILSRLYPTDNETFVRLPGDLDIAAAEFVRLGEAAGIIKKERARWKNALIAAIGDSTWAETPLGLSFSLKEQTRGGIDAARLQSEFPDAYRECYDPARSRFRVLRALKKLPAEALEAPEAGDDDDAED